MKSRCYVSNLRTRPAVPPLWSSRLAPQPKKNKPKGDCESNWEESKKPLCPAAASPPIVRSRKDKPNVRGYSHGIENKPPKAGNRNVTMRKSNASGMNANKRVAASRKRLDTLTGVGIGISPNCTKERSGNGITGVIRRFHSQPELGAPETEVGGNRSRWASGSSLGL